MVCLIKNFEPGCLYIVVTIPHLPYEDPKTKVYPAGLPADFDAGSYETGSAFGIGSEEFEWSIYYHEGPSGGIWHRLVKDVTSVHHGPCPAPKPPVYKLEQRKMEGGWLRLERDIVTIIRVMQLPQVMAETASETEAKRKKNTAMARSEKGIEIDSTSTKASSATATPPNIAVPLTTVLDAGMRGYLDWLTKFTAPNANRTFIWSLSVYLRCRIHAASFFGTADDFSFFNVKEFLRDSLTYCYSEVRFAARGQLPRPIVISQYGVQMLLGYEGNTSRVMLVGVDYSFFPLQQMINGDDEGGSNIWEKETNDEGGYDSEDEDDSEEEKAKEDKKKNVEEWSKTTYLAVNSYEEWPPLPSVKDQRGK
jgi:hypothetical protein